MAYIHYNNKKTKKSKIMVPSTKWKIFSLVCLVTLVVERVLLLVYWNQSKPHIDYLRNEIIKLFNNL